jgi:four helix bundle protein
VEHFEHEGLDVYKAAIQLVGLADRVIDALPRGRGYLADQLARASSSIALNIAEGAGEFAGAEKARFYRIARRSATECAAILDVCSALGLAGPEPVAACRDPLLRIAAMLTRMIQNLSAAH